MQQETANPVGSQPGRPSNLNDPDVIDLTHLPDDEEQTDNQNKKEKKDKSGFRQQALVPSTEEKLSAPTAIMSLSPPSNPSHRGSEHRPAAQKGQPDSSPVITPAIISLRVAQDTVSPGPQLPVAATVPTAGNSTLAQDPEQVRLKDAITAELEAEVKAKEEENQSLENELKDVEKSASESKMKVAELTSALATAADKVATLTDQVENLKKEKITQSRAYNEASEELSNHYGKLLADAEHNMNEEKSRTMAAEASAREAREKLAAQAAENEKNIKVIQNRATELSAQAQARAVAAELALNEANANSETQESKRNKCLNEKLEKLREEKELVAKHAAETEKSLAARLGAADAALKSAQEARATAGISFERKLKAKDGEIESLNKKCEIAEAVQRKANDYNTQKARAVAQEDRANKAEACVTDLKAESAKLLNEAAALKTEVEKLKESVAELKKNESTTYDKYRDMKEKAEKLGDDLNAYKKGEARKKEDEEYRCRDDAGHHPRSNHRKRDRDDDEYNRNNRRDTIERGRDLRRGNHRQEEGRHHYRRHHDNDNDNYRHRNGNDTSGRGGSSTPPPIAFQQIDGSQQVLPAVPAKPATDPRLQRRTKD
jgi:DNA repair exonuclease SbcCD ATPase subunit